MITFLRDNAPWLAAGFLLTLTSSFGQTFFISVFAGEIRAAFGLGHGLWGAIYAGGTLASAMVLVWAGTLTDRFRVRELIRVVLPLFAAACLVMAAVPGAWALPFAIFALRLAGQGMTFHIAVVAMGRWFVVSRGKALSVATLGLTPGQALLPLVFVALLGVLGWRGLWVLAAVLVLAVLPVLQSLLRLERTPQSSWTSDAAAGMGGRQWNRRQVLGHWLFWSVLPLALGPPTFVTALFFHQVHFAEIKDISHLAFVSLFPVFTASAVVGMLASGVAVDRLGSARLLPFAMLPIAAGFYLLARSTGLAGLTLGMLAAGLTMGSMATLPAAFWAEFYGTRNLGAIKAMASALAVFGTAVGPMATGLAIDAGFGFESQMRWIAVYSLAAAALAAVALRRASRTLAPAGEVDVIGP